MTAVLPSTFKHKATLLGSHPDDHYHWIYTRGLVLRALVSLFMWWNIIVFPGQSAPNAWICGLVLCVADGCAWVARRQHPKAIVLWAMVTTGFDLILGTVALTEFSMTIESNAPALLPLIGIELLAYWGWVGYWIAFGYSTIVMITLWPYPSPPLSGYAIARILFWLAVNVLIISSVAVLLHNSPPPPDPALALTAREREVYELLKAGLSQKDIAAQLHIERSTVKTHVQHIHRKLDWGDPPEE